MIRKSKLFAQVYRGSESDLNKDKQFQDPGFWTTYDPPLLLFILNTELFLRYLIIPVADEE